MTLDQFFSDPRKYQQDSNQNNQAWETQNNQLNQYSHRLLKLPPQHVIIHQQEQYRMDNRMNETPIQSKMNHNNSGFSIMNNINPQVTENGNNSHNLLQLNPLNSPLNNPLNNPLNLNNLNANKSNSNNNGIYNFSFSEMNGPYGKFSLQNSLQNSIQPPLQSYNSSGPPGYPVLSSPSSNNATLASLDSLFSSFTPNNNLQKVHLPPLNFSTKPPPPYYPQNQNQNQNQIPQIEQSLDPLPPQFSEPRQKEPKKRTKTKKTREVDQSLGSTPLQIPTTTDQLPYIAYSNNQRFGVLAIALRNKMTFQHACAEIHHFCSNHRSYQPDIHESLVECLGVIFFFFFLKISLPKSQ